MKKSMAYMKNNQDGGGNQPAAGEQLMKDQSVAAKHGSIARMNSYDKDMMHERELIYDAKKQEKTGDAKTKKNDKKLIYDAKGQIHNEDIAKKKHMHVVSRIAGRNSR